MTALEYSLGAFSRYMNRPIARVHVYTWRLACQIEGMVSWGGGSPCVGGIRYRPAYRSASCKAWRQLTVQTLRAQRKAGAVVLPYWTEATGEYSAPYKDPQ